MTPARVPLTFTERAVWACWGFLPDNHPAPVKAIAAALALDPADVAFIVYPAERYGAWADDQEPDEWPTTGPVDGEAWPT